MDKKQIDHDALLAAVAQMLDISVDAVRGRSNARIYTQCRRLVSARLMRAGYLYREVAPVLGRTDYTHIGRLFYSHFEQLAENDQYREWWRQVEKMV